MEALEGPHPELLGSCPSGRTRVTLGRVPLSKEKRELLTMELPAAERLDLVKKWLNMLPGPGRGPLAWEASRRLQNQSKKPI